MAKEDLDGDMDAKKFNALVLKVEKRGHDLIDKYGASEKKAGEQE